MSQCVYLNADGSVTATTETADSCQGFVLLTRAEYASTQTLQSFLAMPSEVQVTSAFNAGIAWPIGFYLAAYLTGLIVNMFNEK